MESNALNVMIGAVPSTMKILQATNIYKYKTSEIPSLMKTAVMDDLSDGVVTVFFLIGGANEA